MDKGDAPASKEAAAKSGGANAAPQEGGPAGDWIALSPDEIVARLSLRDIQLSRVAAQAIRDRAAQLVFADPQKAFLLAKGLLAAVCKQSHAIDHAKLAIAWRCHAEASLFLGRPRAAAQSYAHASAEAEAAKDGGLAGQILVGRIHVLSLIGEMPQADRLARKAERLLRAARDLVYLGKLHMNRGNAHYQREQYRDAYEAYARASRVFTRAGIRDATWAGLLVNQAVACRHLGRTDEARRIYLRAEAECERLGLDSLRSRARYDRGFLEALAGNYTLALTLLDDAERGFERQGILDMKAASQRARAEFYLDLGMAEEARELAEQSAQVFAQQAMGLDAILARIVQARALLLSDRPAEALALLDDAQAFLRQQRIRPRRAAVMLQQAKAAISLARPRDAAALARRAARIFNSAGMSRARSQSLRILADALMAENRHSAAESAIAPALALIRQQPLAEQVDLLALAGTISRARGRSVEAARRLQKAAEKLEAFRQLIPGPEFRASAFEEHVRVYHDLIELALAERRPRLDRIFRLIEAARARGFRDRMSAAPAAARDEIAALRAQLGSLLRKLEEAEYAQRDRPDASSLRHMQNDVKTLERRIADRIRRVEGTRAGAEQWGGAPDPGTIAQRLRPDETLLEYFITSERVVAVALRRESAALVPLPAAPRSVREAIQRMLFQLDVVGVSPEGSFAESDFIIRSIRETLQEMHSALIAPLAHHLPECGRLIVIPHRWLHEVPFECLWDGHDYIDSRFTIIRCPTAEILSRPKSRSRRARDIVVAGAELAEAPAIATEVQAVGGLFPPERVQLMPNASRAALLDAISSCRLFHLSTHAVFRHDNPLFSRLATGDGAIFVADILERRLSADLAVLSACSTGKAFAGRGDDLSGVAHAFLAAGARQLVASRWRVHDEATSELMKSFYRHYIEDPADAAAALVAAAREVRAIRPHPFYWAGFSVHGR